MNMQIVSKTETNMKRIEGLSPDIARKIVDSRCNRNRMPGGKGKAG